MKNKDDADFFHIPFPIHFYLFSLLPFWLLFVFFLEELSLRLGQKKGNRKKKEVEKGAREVELLPCFLDPLCYLPVGVAFASSKCCVFILLFLLFGGDCFVGEGGI